MSYVSINRLQVNETDSLTKLEQALPKVQFLLLFCLLSTLHDDCRGSEECPVVKCSDDTASIQTCQTPTSHSLTLCTGSLSGVLIITLILAF